MAEQGSSSHIKTKEPIVALMQESLEALSTLDADRLEQIALEAEIMHTQASAPTLPRVSQAAAREVQAMRELMRFTSQRLAILQTLHREHHGDSDSLAPWRTAWAR
jgi:hypothetical protein